MFCYISRRANWVCPKAYGPECLAYYLEGVRYRNAKGTCVFADMRDPNLKKKPVNKKRVGQQKQAK